MGGISKDGMGFIRKTVLKARPYYYYFYSIMYNVLNIQYTYTSMSHPRVLYLYLRGSSLDIPVLPYSAVQYFHSIVKAASI